MFDERADVFAGDVGDGFEEGVSGQQHLTPHVALVLLGGSCAGQAQEFVEHLKNRTQQQHNKRITLKTKTVFLWLSGERQREKSSPAT